MSEPKVRDQWTYQKPKLDCKDKSRTKQADAKDADVNVIIKKALRNGRLPDPSKASMYLDVASGQDFQDSMALVLNAQAQFQALPSEIRQELQNDPSQLESWISNPANNERMYELGIKERPDVPGASTESIGSTQASSSKASGEVAKKGDSKAQGTA